MVNDSVPLPAARLCEMWKSRGTKTRTVLRARRRRFSPRAAELKCLMGNDLLTAGALVGGVYPVVVTAQLHDETSFIVVQSGSGFSQIYTDTDIRGLLSRSAQTSPVSSGGLRQSECFKVDCVSVF